MTAPQWQIDAQNLKPIIPEPPVASSGLIGQTMQSTPSSYSSVAAPTTGKAETYDWNVTPEQTVESRMQGLISQNSPLMQQADTIARQEANARGGLLGSYAQGARQDAVMRQALPIASQDATTFGNAAQANAQARTGAEANRAAMEQQTSLTNAGAQTAALAQNAQQTQAASQLNAQQQNLMQTQQAELAQKSNEFNVDNITKQQLANADASLKTLLSMADKDTREYLGELDANSRALLQTSSGAATIFANYLNEMAQVQTSQNLDLAGKTAAMENLKTGMKDALAIQGAIADLDLVGLLV